MNMGCSLVALRDLLLQLASPACHSDSTKREAASEWPGQVRPSFPMKKGLVAFRDLLRPKHVQGETELLGLCFKIRSRFLSRFAG